MPKEDETRKQFEQMASRRRANLLSEFVQFLRYNRKWWLAPILAVLLLVGLLVVLGGTGLGPWIYALF